MKQYAVLLSCASEAVYGPDLVVPTVYASGRAAADAGPSRSTGLRFAIMYRQAPDDQWRELGSGRSAVDTIRARWES